jgi:hypothetical protein
MLCCAELSAATQNLEENSAQNCFDEGITTGVERHNVPLKFNAFRASQYSGYHLPISQSTMPDTDTVSFSPSKE